MSFAIPAINNHLEIISSRVFNFPQALVFKAWATAEHLQNWWGPAGFTNTFHEFNFQPGGRWRFTMHGPEKGNYENEVEFISIEAPSFIYWKRHSQPLFHVLATFEAVTDEKTKLVFRMLFNTEAECNKIKRFAVKKTKKILISLKQSLKK